MVGVEEEEEEEEKKKQEETRAGVFELCRG